MFTVYIQIETATYNRKQNYRKMTISVCCCKWKMETANFSLFAANGKWKQQTSVCLLQMEKENGSLFPLVDKDKR
jgi:hypothetical protein